MLSLENEKNMVDARLRTENVGEILSRSTQICDTHYLTTVVYRAVIEPTSKMDGVAEIRYNVYVDGKQKDGGVVCSVTLPNYSVLNE